MRRLRHWYRQKLAKRLARLLPRQIVAWTAVRVIVHATTGRFGNTDVLELTAMDALKRWNESR